MSQYVHVNTNTLFDDFVVCKNIPVVRAVAYKSTGKVMAGFLSLSIVMYTA